MIAHYPAESARSAAVGKRQTVCKPGSVLSRDRDGHSSGTFVTERLARPTRAAARRPARHGLRRACRSYLVLLPVGFSLPSPLLATRCALTAPFHPCRASEEAVGGMFSVALSLGSPPPAVNRHRVSLEPGLSSLPVAEKSGHPTVWRGILWADPARVSKPAVIARSVVTKQISTECALGARLPRRASAPRNDKPLSGAALDQGNEPVHGG